MTAAIAQDALPRTPRTAGNEDTSLLKWIALLFMIIDHVGAALLPQYTDMRVLGRIAFPLYIWCAVVGVSYTRNPLLYALRLLLVGAAAQPCYMFALSHDALEFNVFATLLLGVLGASGIREKWHGSHIWAPILAILLSLAVDMDYGWQGVLLILLMYMVRRSRPGIAAVMIAYCLFWGQGTFAVTRLFGMPIPRSVPFLSDSASLISAVTRVQFFAILALPLMLIRTHSGLRMPKWAGYAAYPVHLLIIGAIRYFWM